MTLQYPSGDSRGAWTGGTGGHFGEYLNGHPGRFPLFGAVLPAVTRPARGRQRQISSAGD